MRLILLMTSIIAFAASAGAEQPAAGHSLVVASNSAATDAQAPQPKGEVDWRRGHSEKRPHSEVAAQEPAAEQHAAEQQHQ